MSKLFDIEARVKDVLDREEIGKYYKQTVVFTELDDYPQDLAIDFWNANLELVDPLRVGDLVKVVFRAKSREYNGKYYTNLNGQDVEKLIVNQPAPPAPSPRQQPLPRPTQPKRPSRGYNNMLDDEDVPF